MTQLTVGSLFSGIGGLELGLEMTGGFTARWHSEVDPFCCAVLKKHWPDCPNHGDITAIDWARVEPVDLVCGGFPCQDISLAGKGAGIKEDTRSGLWYEFERCLGALRPRYALIENVAALRIRGLDTVLCGLARLGYDAVWETFPAAAVGAPHKRSRLFIVAYTCSRRQPQPEGTEQRQRGRAEHGGQTVADTCICRRAQGHREHDVCPGQPVATSCGCKAMADAQQQSLRPGLRPGGAPGLGCRRPGDDDGEVLGDTRSPGREELHAASQPAVQGHAASQPAVQGHAAWGGAPDPPGGGFFASIGRSGFWDDHDLVRCGDGALRPVKPGVRLLADGIPGWARELPDAQEVPVPEGNESVPAPEPETQYVYSRVQMLKALGNAVLPQVPEQIGYGILRHAGVATK